MRAPLALALALSTLASACLDAGRPGTVADTAPADAALADASPADSATADGSPACPVTDLRFTAHALEDAASPWHVAVASAAAIYWTGSDYSYPDPDLGLQRVDPATGALAAVTAPGRGDRVLDAREGALLLRRALPGGEQESLIYRDDAGETVLSDGLAGEQVWTGAPYPTDTPRWVGHRRAAWQGCVERSGWECTRSALRAWLGGDVRTLWSTPHSATAHVPPPPDLDPSGVVWVEPDPAAGDFVVRAWDGGEPLTLHRTPRAVTRVARAGTQLLWIDAEGVWSLAPAAAPRLLVSGHCGPLAVDGPRAAFVCAPSDPTPGGWSAFAGTAGGLHLFDGAATRAVPTTGALVALPRLDGPWLAWLEYPRASDGCFDLGPGEVRAAPVLRPDAAVTLGEIGIGCYCCAMVWPDLQLALHDGVAAWNYASPSPQPLTDGRFGQLGWARLTPGTTCDSP